MEGFILPSLFLCAETCGDALHEKGCEATFEGCSVAHAKYHINKLYFYWQILNCVTFCDLIIVVYFLEVGMKQLIQDEVKRSKNDVKTFFDEDIQDERAFSYTIIKYYYMLKDMDNYGDIKDMITDGANDGGIDFVVYDEETPKVIVGQSKMTKDIDTNTILSELNKMSDTIKCFIDGNTGSFNKQVKNQLQNALDRLPDEDAGNVEYVVFTTSSVNEESLYKRIEKGDYSFSKEMVTIYPEDEIESQIQNVWESINKVEEDKVSIDRPKNILEYENDELEGIMVNISSRSITQLYNKYSDRGLFDLNIRKYIRSKLVDSGINKTLNEERENFWFLNNGLIIACDDYVIDGDNIKLYGFSIVNGGQTTTLIGKYDGSNTQEFYVPCKIVSKKEDDDSMDFFSKIAEATNSQKPIYARDLKSNSPEMRTLQKWLGDENVFLEIKRGDTKGRKNKKYKIKNDELGQLILSFVNQQPGTSRSGKKNIFENNNTYTQIYKQNYEKDPNKKQFILDLIDLNDRYIVIEDELKKGSDLMADEKEILKNGKQVMFAIMGALYRLINEDIKEKELLQDIKLLKTTNFTYGGFISNYKDDDLEKLMKNILCNSITKVTELYNDAMNRGECTSVSNYFKTDKKYQNDIMVGFIKAYCRQSLGKDLKEDSKIFLRK